MNKTVIIKPIISEKSFLLASNGVYSFVVRNDANKHLVSDQIEKLFKVDVVAVNIINTDGKVKRSGKKIGKRGDVKKAYVRLKAGQKIAIFESDEEKKEEKNPKSKTKELKKEKVKTEEKISKDKK